MYSKSPLYFADIRSNTYTPATRSSVEGGETRRDNPAYALRIIMIAVMHHVSNIARGRHNPGAGCFWPRGLERHNLRNLAKVVHKNLIAGHGRGLNLQQCCALLERLSSLTTTSEAKRAR